MAEDGSGRRRFTHILLKLLTGLLSVALIVLTGALLVLAQPKPEEKEKAEPQPLLTASPALNISHENELRELVESFPAPVLSFMSGSGMTFVSGTSADAGLPGGFGRVVTLYWQTEEGEPLILRSIYPASALSLLEKGYHFSAVAGPTLFGVPSVRMENDETVRLHTATDQALYVVLLPRALSGQVSSLCGSLQLYSATAD